MYYIFDYQSRFNCFAQANFIGKNEIEAGGLVTDITVKNTDVVSVDADGYVTVNGNKTDIKVLPGESVSVNKDNKVVIGGVDLIAECTLTTEGFKTGVLNAFEAMAIIVNSTNEGGTN